MGKKNDDNNEFNPVEYLEAVAAELGVGVVKSSSNPEVLKDEIGRTCNILHMLYSGFLEAGFSEEQAWELIKLSLNKN